MADRPIIFSAPMIRALLAGTKTQTRRVLKLPTKTHSGGPIYERPDMGGWEATTAGGGGEVYRDGTPVPEMAAIWHRTTGVCMAAPYQAGDRLWVREAHYLTDQGYFEVPVYAADEGAAEMHREKIEDIAQQYRLGEEWKRPHLKLRSPIHMPRWASRITLHIEDVRVQRVQDISEADARAEGCPGRLGPDPEFPDEWDPSPVEEFRDLWNSIHGPDAWDRNDWVAAITFRAIHANIDAGSAHA